MENKKGTALWVALVLDESGSMEGNRDQTISGFNEFLQDRQKDAQERPVKMWLSKFNTSQTLMLSGADVREVRPMSREDYKPEGGTALYDAVASTVYAIDAEFSKLARNAEKPRIMVVVMTDGEENSSREINSDTLSRIIKNRERSEYWNFTYVGANQDAILSARTMGMTLSGGMTTSNAAFGSAIRGASKRVSLSACVLPGQTMNKAATYTENSIRAMGMSAAEEMIDLELDENGEIKKKDNS